MEELQVLCRFDELEDPGSRGFEARETGAPWDFFIVLKQGAVYGYRNSCPHTGAPLDWMPHCFLDPEGGFIQCAMHGALFRADNGECLRGPCAGQSLVPISVRVIDSRVVLERLSEKAAFKGAGECS